MLPMSPNLSNPFGAGAAMHIALILHLPQVCFPNPNLKLETPKASAVNP